MRGTGGDPVVPGTRDLAGGEALLHARGRLVHRLHLRGDDQSAPAVPRRLSAQIIPRRAYTPSENDREVVMNTPYVPSVAAKLFRHSPRLILHYATTCCRAF